jgi:GntR family transcriptional regulator
MPNNPLDRTSFDPLYYQLAEKLKVLIDHSLTPGAAIPSENDLMARYNVSRNTVRQAIDQLAKQGWVTRIQGKGTYVASERRRYLLHKLVSFTEDMHRRGLQPDTRLLGLKKIVPLLKISHALKLEPTEEVFEVQRLRLADDEPMAISTSYIPCKLLPNITDEQMSGSSLFWLIENNAGSKLGYGERVIKPAVADDYLAEMLCVPKGAPLMLVEGTTHLENDRACEYVHVYYRGDRYEFSIHSVR